MNDPSESSEAEGNTKLGEVEADCRSRAAVAGRGNAVFESTDSGLQSVN